MLCGELDLKRLFAFLYGVSRSENSVLKVCVRQQELLKL